MVRGRFESLSKDASEGIISTEDVEDGGGGYGEPVVAMEADWLPGEGLTLGCLPAAMTGRSPNTEGCSSIPRLPISESTIVDKISDWKDEERSFNCVQVVGPANGALERN